MLSHAKLEVIKVSDRCMFETNAAFTPCAINFLFFLIFSPTTFPSEKIKTLKLNNALSINILTIELYGICV